MPSAREKKVSRFEEAAIAVAYFDKNRRIKNTDMKVQRCVTLAWNCDGSKLVCGAHDRRVSVASVDSGRLRWSFVGSSHTDSVEQVSCRTDDASTFASASLDRSVCVWDIRHVKHQRIQTKGQNLFVGWSNCGKYIIAGDKDDKLHTIDVRNLAVVKTYEMKVKSNEFVVHPTSDHILVTSANGRVEVLKFENGEINPVATIHAHAPHVECMAISVSADGNKMAVGATDAACSIWNLEDVYCERVVTRLDYPVRSVSFSCNNQLLAAGSEDHSIDVAFVDDGSRIADLKIDGETFCVAWHPSQLLLAYAASDARDKRDSACVKVFGYYGG